MDWGCRESDVAGGGRGVRGAKKVRRVRRARRVRGWGGFGHTLEPLHTRTRMDLGFRV